MQGPLRVLSRNEQNRNIFGNCPVYRQKSRIWTKDETRKKEDSCSTARLRSPYTKSQRFAGFERRLFSSTGFSDIRCKRVSPGNTGRKIRKTVPDASKTWICGLPHRNLERRCRKNYY